MKKSLKSKVKSPKLEEGFTLVELVVYVGIIGFIVTALVAFSLGAIQTGAKIKANSEVLDNARRAMEIMQYEIKKSKNIYTPTSIFGASPGQLGLEQSATSTPGEAVGFVDFFACGDSLCLKRDSSTPVSLISDKVKINSLIFRQLENSTSSSVQIILGVESINASVAPDYASSVELQSAANPRGY
ncbi:MAG: type II secretion system protein [bacterium]